MGLVLRFALVIALTSCSKDEPRDPPAKNEEQHETPRPRTWNVHVVHDPMRDIDIRVAELVSTNAAALKFPYEGETHATLTLYRRPNGLFADINAERGQVKCSEDSCGIDIKFDDEPVEKLFAKPLEKNTGVYSVSPLPFVEHLLHAKKLTIELVFYDDGPWQFSFEVPAVPAEFKR